MGVADDFIARESDADCLQVMALLKAFFSICMLDTTGGNRRSQTLFHFAGSTTLR
jgi:hypothetical protein